MQRNQYHRLLALLMTVVTIFQFVSIAPQNVFAAERAGTAGVADHYIAVASDRHSNTSAIANAMGGMPSNVEFVCLAGDMTTNQAFSTSTLQTEVKSGAGLSNA